MSGWADPVPALERIALRVGLSASLLFAAAAVIVVYEVVARYVFDAPTTWATALTTTLCAVAFALGGAFSMARGEHIRITTLLDRTGPGLRRWADRFAMACGALYLGGFGYAAVLGAWESLWRFQEGRWAPELTPGPPNWPLPTVLRVVLALAVLLFLLLVLRRLFARRPSQDV